MKEIKNLLSPASRSKYETCVKKYGASSFRVVGMQLTEQTLLYTEPLQAGGQKSSGLPGISGIPLQWHGVSDFAVEPGCFEYLCTPDKTYQEVLKGFLKETVSTLLKKETGPVLLSFRFPPHWSGSKLPGLLEQCFGSMDRVIPVLAEAPEADVFVDRSRTVFNLNGKRYTVAYGTGTDHTRFRLNDYLNTGALWSERSFDTWEAGFLDICRSLTAQGKLKDKPTLYIAPERKAEKLLIQSGLTPQTPVLTDPAAQAAQWLLEMLPQKTQHTSDPVKPPVGPTPDPGPGNDEGKKPRRRYTESEDPFDW